MTESECMHTVMVVEDDAAIRESIAEILEDNDFRPVLAAHGKEAAEQLRAMSDAPCVILLDLMMPVMDGWEFREVQRTDPKLSSIPVVVLSAHTNIREAEERIAPAAYLSKPLQFDALLAILERFCPKHALP